jgi:dTDP-4-amino-4,6-dideoxygalactose transaminase
MTIPFLDLGRLHQTIRSELDDAIDRVVQESSFIGGPAVVAFEQAFATAHGRRHCTGCGSGTDALSLALCALGVGQGDEVIVPSFTFFATAEAVTHTGAQPVIVDVDPDTLLLGPDPVELARTSRTRAIVPVHLFGHVVPFDHLEAWRASGLLVIEDAAQAHLATWRGRSIGSVSDAACFSFFPGKNLGALGDAGAVITDNLDLYERTQRRRDHGRSQKYVHSELGVSSRLDGLQAAVLLVKLRHLAAWTEGRRRVAAWYRERLSALGGITLIPWEAGAVHHLLVARVRAHKRDEMRAALGERHIATGIHYPLPLSRQPPFVERSVECPVAEAASAEVLSLPMDPFMTEEEVDYVSGAIEAILHPKFARLSGGTAGDPE